MSDAEHDRIARLLRERGQAEAPPGLSDDVMAQVRREPQTGHGRSGRVWRPVAAVAAAAAVLLAIGFGIASLSNNAGSPSGAGSAAAEGGGTAKAPALDQAGAGVTVARSDASRILGPLARFSSSQAEGTVGSSAGSAPGQDVIELSRAAWKAYRRALTAAAARTPHPEDPVVVQPRRN